MHGAECVIFNESEMGTVSGALGMNVFRSFCEVRSLGEEGLVSCAIGDIAGTRVVGDHFFLGVWGVTGNTIFPTHTEIILFFTITRVPHSSVCLELRRQGDKAWKSVVTTITEGSYDILPAYTRPEPNKAPEYDADNY